MRKTKGTKQALLLSVMSLLLCVSMLVGTTFAWFTDSVSTGKNIIAAGNLDVELYWSTDCATWNPVDADTNVFKQGALWEPGYTEVVYLKVVNEGSLHLKYPLGVNVVSEITGTAVTGDPLKLSEHILYGVAETDAKYADREAARADVTGVELKNAYSSEVTALAPAAEKTVAMVVYMPETVGNVANYLTGTAAPQITLGLNLMATQKDAELDAFGPDYDKNAQLVASAEEAQYALDHAVPGTTIFLAPNVAYGTLYMRPSADVGVTREVDWVGNNYRYETYSRFADLTIIGAEGAVVDAIEIEGQTYYNTEHSQSEQYPIMLSLIELDNVVIDGVTFTGNGGFDPQGYGNAINLSGSNIKVDGLTLKNCVLDNAANNARLIYKTEATNTVHTYIYDGETYTFSPTLANITVTGCAFNGGYMGLELRETENVTITNNIFNVANRNILLPANADCAYSGAITITGNISNYAQERFVRADGMGDAVVTITDNTLNNYAGKDVDYIKVTNINSSPTIERNTVTYATAASDTDTLFDALKAGGTVVLTDDIVLTKTETLSNVDFVLDGNGHTITQDAGCVNAYALFDSVTGKATIKNVTFDSIKGGAIIRTVGCELTVNNITVQNSEHTQEQGLLRLIGKSTITNSTFKNNDCSMVITLNYDRDSNDPQIVQNCLFEGNTCSSTAVVYYVKGEIATIDGNSFVNNTVNISGNNNGAIVYMGFTENNVITNNLFQGNTLKALDTTRVRISGGLMVGYASNITGNAFIDNTVDNKNGTAKGNDVLASVYYSDIDLSGNYWGGNAPVADEDYQQEYTANSVIVNSYATSYTVDADGVGVTVTP